MIVKEQIIPIVLSGLEESDCFLVDVIVHPGNLIVVEIDREDGVEIDNCIALSRHIDAALDRDIEDYELEVGSAGITSPFKVTRQYRMNVGNEVEVLGRDGRKRFGELVDADEQGFTLRTRTKQNVDGSKRKQWVDEDTPIPYDTIKYCKNVIKFK